MREAIGPGVAAEIERLIGRMGESPGGGADLRGAIAGPLSTFTVARVLGIPAALQETLRAWYEEFAAALASFEEASAARVQGRVRAAESRALARSIVSSATGADDTTLLGLRARPAPGQLTEHEASSNAPIVRFGGIETTEAAMLNAADHLSFGAGRHVCLGAALARYEIRAALGALLARLPGLRFDDDRPSRPRGHEFRKPPELWVRWDGRRSERRAKHADGARRIFITIRAAQRSGPHTGEGP